MLTLMSVVLLPGLAFALAYPSLVNRLSRGLVSPHPKADATRRLNAAFLDASLVATFVVSAWTTGAWPYAALGAAYVLFRDAIAGQSIGKLVLGLVVIELESGRPASMAGSAKRNLVLLLPGANLVAIVLEARTILTDPQGQRLGDRFAQTQVIEAAGARDLVRSFQNWAIQLGRMLGTAPGRRRPLPERFDRAARDGVKIRPT
jgi:uncharacterized RDD family membrane protein YckC